jgi:hypothetical protein
MREADRMRIESWRRIETWTTVAMVGALVLRVLAKYLAEDLEHAATVILAVTLAASLLSWLGLQFAKARHGTRSSEPAHGA